MAEKYYALYLETDRNNPIGILDDSKINYASKISEVLGANCAVEEVSEKEAQRIEGEISGRKLVTRIEDLIALIDVMEE